MENITKEVLKVKIWTIKLTEYSDGSSILERLINSHFSLFRRLNQINNKEPQSEATQKALEEAREVNRFFSDKDSPRIVQS